MPGVREGPSHSPSCSSEIEALRDYMRVAIEEHGAVQEELKSAHEEMLSANEEYQSTNEELETSKEELQSTNEELTTTIEELRNRNRDLGVLNAELEHARLASERALAYADGIIEAVRSPLAVIDTDMRIRRVNRAFAWRIWRSGRARRRHAHSTTSMVECGACRSCWRD